MTDHAIVAGATGALGSAIVGRLRDAGVRVVAIARSAADLDALAGADDGIVPLPGDLADDRLVADLTIAVDTVVDGPLRMVVQAAGLPGSGSVETLTAAEVVRGVDTKIGGFLRVLRGVEHRLGDGARIVVLGGHYGYEPSAAAPLAGMANAAIGNLVRALADHWGPRGVTVHHVAPGPVESPRMAAIAARAAARRADGTTADDVLDEYRSAAPLGRLTRVEEVAWAVGLLLDPHAACLHGSTLSLDLGRRRGVG